MKLPSGDHAIVDDAKLVEYCLSPVHPRGKHKAKLFASLLGLSAAQAGVLKSALLAAARDEEAVERGYNGYGRQYSVEFDCTGPGGTVKLLSAWIILDGEDFPRLVTCYPV